MRRPGIEPGSAVWDTTMLATTPPALPASCEPNASKVQPNAVQGTLCVGRGGWRCAAQDSKRVEENRIESQCIARTAACGISTALMRPKTGCVSINQQLHIFGMLPTERESGRSHGRWHVALWQRGSRTNVGCLAVELSQTKASGFA